ncbi:MAG: type II CAAX endopeptidase family protein [Candidatus Acidiferrales bacterium]
MTFPDPENPAPPPVPPPAPSNDAPSSPSGPHPPDSVSAQEIFLSPPHFESLNVPEDIRTPWGGGELLIFLGLAIGSLFVMETVLALFMIAHFHMTSEQLMKRLGTDAPLAVSFQASWYVVILLFLFVMIRVYHGAPFWSSLRWRLLRPRDVPATVQYLTCIFGGITLAFAVSAASQFAGEKKNLPIEQLFGTRTDVLWLAAFGIALAPLIEETFFRGFLYPVLARKWGIAAGIVVTGVLFGGMHAPQLWPAFPQIGLLMVVGIVLTFARARSGSVLASYLIHVSYNSFLFAGFFVGTHGLKNIPPIH